MGSRVNVCGINFLNNPANFKEDFKLEITFEVFENLPGDLEWKLVYVGSGDSDKYDQELDSALIGPTPEGKHKFVLDTPAPDASKIPDQDVAGVSVLLLKVKYNGNEFLNLGWWVSNEYTDEELKENPPAKPDVDKLLRTVKSDDIRVTTYPIRWNESDAEEQPPVVEEEEIDEADLMPLEDEKELEDDVAEEDEEEAHEEGDVDLDESREEVAADDAEEPMDDSIENGADRVEAKAAKEAGDAPLGDMTNE